MYIVYVIHTYMIDGGCMDVCSNEGGVVVALSIIDEPLTIIIHTCLCVSLYLSYISYADITMRSFTMSMTCAPERNLSCLTAAVPCA